MNSNLFQTILTVLLTACGVLTSILLGFGCTQDTAGALSCSASTAPEWLAPYLAVSASALGIVWKHDTRSSNSDGGKPSGGRMLVTLLS